MEQCPRTILNVQEWASKCYSIFFFDPPPLPILGSHNFLIFYLFVKIFMPQMRQEEGFDFSLDIMNKSDHPWISLNSKSLRLVILP